MLVTCDWEVFPSIGDTYAILQCVHCLPWQRALFFVGGYVATWLQSGAVSMTALLILLLTYILLPVYGILIHSVEYAVGGITVGGCSCWCRSILHSDWCCLCSAVLKEVLFLGGYCSTMMWFVVLERWWREWWCMPLLRDGGELYMVWWWCIADTARPFHYDTVYMLMLGGWYDVIGYAFFFLILHYLPLYTDVWWRAGRSIPCLEVVKYFVGKVILLTFCWWCSGTLEWLLYTSTTVHRCSFSICHLCCLPIVMAGEVLFMPYSDLVLLIHDVLTIRLMTTFRGWRTCVYSCLCCRRGWAEGWRRARRGRVWWWRDIGDTILVRRVIYYIHCLPSSYCVIDVRRRRILLWAIMKIYVLLCLRAEVWVSRGVLLWREVTTDAVLLWKRVFWWYWLRRTFWLVERKYGGDAEVLTMEYMWSLIWRGTVIPFYIDDDYACGSLRYHSACLPSRIAPPRYHLIADAIYLWPVPDDAEPIPGLIPVLIAGEFYRVEIRDHCLHFEGVIPTLCWCWSTLRLLYLMGYTFYSLIPLPAATWCAESTATVPYGDVFSDGATWWCTWKLFGLWLFGVLGDHFSWCQCLLYTAPFWWWCLCWKWFCSAVSMPVCCCCCWMPDGRNYCCQSWVEMPALHWR